MMRLDQIDSAARLATKLASLKGRREAWSVVDLTDAILARRINDCGTHNARNVPQIDDDVDMHCAIVTAIIAEYDRRILEVQNELVNMGVEGIP